MTDAVRTDTARTKPGLSGLASMLSAWPNPAARILNVDLAAVLLAVMLPWSTSGVSVAAVLWVGALLPTIQPGELVRSLRRPICLAPLALFVLALAGTLWSDASWGERLHAVSPTLKLLVLPLLLYHFERTERGAWVLVGFLASCTLLLAASWAVACFPDLSPKHWFSHGAYDPGVVVKNYIDQSQEFAACVVALAYPVVALWRANQRRQAAWLAALALGFLINLLYVVISRTALVTMPILFVLFTLLHLKFRIAVASWCVMALLAFLVWNTSPNLRGTVSKFDSDQRLTAVQQQPSGMGSRLEFWKKSLGFFAEAPVFGHGTGSTRGLFERAAAGQSGVRAEVIGNPHNQTLYVAVQWGVIGIVALYAMWGLHLLLFRGTGAANWIGLLVVAQNFLTSLFNSHLFDFHEGWVYVLGVGVAGGIVLRASRSHRKAPREEFPAFAGSRGHHVPEAG